MKNYFNFHLIYTSPPRLSSSDDLRRIVGVKNRLQKTDKEDENT